MVYLSHIIPRYPKFKLMAFRIHLSNQTIRQLHILPGKNPQLAVWIRRNHVQFYDLDTGTFLQETVFAEVGTTPRDHQAWRDLLSQTKGIETPHYLPYVHIADTDIFSTDDGAMRVYRQRDDRLFIENEGIEEALTLIDAERLIRMDLDGALGVLVGLDEHLHLHIYQQNIRVGTFDIGLEPHPQLRADVVIARGGNLIYATDGQRIVQVDTGGTVNRTLETHYYIGRLTCSPSGTMLVTSDTEAGVLRAYQGEKLVLTHQKFAIDLIASANQLQLLADLPPADAALSAVVAYQKGILAFAMAGVVCVTDVQQMEDVPRPKRLL